MKLLGKNFGWSAILNLKNLWALDTPLFFVLALEALRPGILITKIV
jgi:hypothetical protein